MHTLVMCDSGRDLRSIASEVGISFGAVQSILNDILGMSKVSAKWVLSLSHWCPGSGVVLDCIDS